MAVGFDPYGLDCEHPMPIERAAITEYLDRCIVKWRKIRDSLPFAVECFPDFEDPSEVAKMRKAAVYYIDAYQSARASIIGSTLE